MKIELTFDEDRVPKTKQAMAAMFQKLADNLRIYGQERTTKYDWSHSLWDKNDNRCGQMNVKQ